MGENVIDFAVFFCLFGSLLRPSTSDKIVSRVVGLQSHEIHCDSSKLTSAATLHKQHLVVGRNISKINQQI